MKHAYLALLAMMPTIGCAANVSSGGPETIGQTSQATSAGGMSASITVTSHSSTNFNATVTVSNNTDAPAYNWNVSVNLGGATLQQGFNGGSAYSVGGNTVFVPDQNGSVIGSGSSHQISFQASYSGTMPTPTIALVDGVANGTQGLGLTDGVDHVSRAAAMAAYNVGTAYEANKLANNGDSYYGFYDSLVLSAHAYRVTSDGTQIEFDPNAPGYAFIPDEAKAELAFAEADAATAMYLVTGLADCFAYSSGQNFWDFKTQVLGTGTSAPGGWSQNATTLSGYDGSVDTFSSTSAPVSGTGNASQITITMTPSTFGSQYDQWFGVLTSNNANFFPAWSSDYVSNALPKISKFTGGNGSACSPFNGAGGGNANPYFVTKLNGSTISAHFQGVGGQCQNKGQCTSTLVTDPALYAQSPQAYDTNNNLIGPVSNPFQYDPNYQYAVPSHEGQFALESNLITMGAFTTPITKFGVTKWMFTLNQ